MIPQANWIPKREQISVLFSGESPINSRSKLLDPAGLTAIILIYWPRNSKTTLEQLLQVSRDRRVTSTIQPLHVGSFSVFRGGELLARINTSLVFSIALRFHSGTHLACEPDRIFQGCGLRHSSCRLEQLISIEETPSRLMAAGETY